MDLLYASLSGISVIGLGNLLEIPRTLLISVLLGMGVLLVTSVWLSYRMAFHKPGIDKLKQATQGGLVSLLLTGTVSAIATASLPILLFSVAASSVFIITEGVQDLLHGMVGISYLACGMGLMGMPSILRGFRKSYALSLHYLAPLLRSESVPLSAITQHHQRASSKYASGTFILVMLLLPILPLLLYAYLNHLRFTLYDIALKGSFYVDQNILIAGEKIRALRIEGLIELLDLHMANMEFILGILLGALTIPVLIMVYCQTSQRDIQRCTEESRSQFSDVAGIWDFTQLPNYQRLLDLALTDSLRYLPLLIGTLLGIPFLACLFFGITGTIGLVVGAALMGIVVALILTIFGHYLQLNHLNMSKPLDGNAYVNSAMANILGSIAGNNIATLLAALLPFLILAVIFATRLSIY